MRRAGLLLCALLGCGPPALPPPASPLSATPKHAFHAQVPSAGEAPQVDVPALDERRLSSGLRVVTVTMPRAREAAALFLSPRATKTDGPCEPEVLAITLAAMARHAARSRPLDAVAHLSPLTVGSFGTFTALSWRSPGADLRRLLGAARRVLTGPPPDDRAVALARAALLDKLEHDKRGEYLRRAREWVFGFAEGAQRLDQEVTRRVQTADVAACRAQVFTADEGALIVAGPNDADQVMAAASELLGAFDRTGVAYTPQRPTLALPARTEARLYPFRSRQVRLAVAQRAPPVYSPDRWPYYVLVHVLGAGTTSRLNERVRRDLNASYGASARLEGAGMEQALFIHAAVAPSLTHETLRAVLDELDRLRRRPIDAGELAAAKTALLVALAELFSDPASVAIWAAGQLTRPPALRSDWHAAPAQVAALTAAQVRDVAARYLDPRRAAIAIGGRWIRVRKELLGAAFPLRVRRAP